ncbi:MAG: oligosaccharide flippase family protein [Burkholderiales bacterium]|nr:oligosaccharide flippase family protein [Burkholderiales bacterium]
MKKDFLINAAGIGAGQLIVLAATPVLARIYSPNEFGIYASLVAISAIISSIASLRFDVAIPSVSNENINPLFQISIILPFFVSIIFVFIYKITSNYFSISLDKSLSAAWITSVASFLGCTNVCLAWFTRKGMFAWSAAIKVLQPLAFTAAALIIPFGLNGALLFSWIIAFILGIFACHRAFKNISISDTYSAVRSSIKYPIVSMPMALLDTASLSLPLFFIVSEFGNSSAGNYSQIQRLLAAPLMLMGIAASQVFYKHAGDLYRDNKNIGPLMWKVVRSLLLLSMLLGVFIVLFGEATIALILGSNWRTDLKFLLLAIAPIIFRMIVSPISVIFLITDRLGLSGLWQTIYFLVTCGTIIYAKNRLSLDQYLFTLGFAEFMMYSSYLLLAIVAVNSNRKPLFPAAS